MVILSLLVLTTTACGGGGGGSSVTAGTTPPVAGASPTPTPLPAPQQVQIIRTNLAEPGNILADASVGSGGQLYFTDFAANNVTGLNVATGAGVTFTPAGNPSVFDIAQDALNVYVTFNQGQNLVGQIPKPFASNSYDTYIVDGSLDSSAWPPCLQSTPFASLCHAVPSGVAPAFVPGKVYFACGNGIGSVSSTGGAYTVLYNAQGNTCTNNAFYTMATDSGGVYLALWGAAKTTIQYITTTGSVQGSVGGFGTIYALVPGVPNTTGGGALFFIDATSSTLYQVRIVGNTGGTAPIALAQGVGSPIHARSLAVDANFVYFVTAGAIAKVAINGTGGSSTPVTIVTAANAANPVGIAVDATTIYWTAFGNGVGSGSIRSVPKS